jgi:hypothetical protein
MKWHQGYGIYMIICINFNINIMKTIYELLILSSDKTMINSIISTCQRRKNRVNSSDKDIDELIESLKKIRTHLKT